MAEVTQIAYCTRDIEGTALAMSEIDQVGPFFLAEFPLHDLIWKGEPVHYGKLKVAFAYRGSLQIELIQVPDGQASCYADGIGDHREFFHHTYVRTAEDYDAIVARHVAASEPLAYHGRAGEDGVRFGFIDARARLGHFIEVLETNQAGPSSQGIFEMYGRMEQASRTWDGTRPIRQMAEVS